MSVHFKKHGVPYVADFGTVDNPTEHGRTKQSFKNDCDINMIMNRFKKTGVIDHLTKYEARYGEFAGFNFHEHMEKLAEADEIFSSVPSEVRARFGNSAADFFDFVTDPANKGTLREKLPELATPQAYLPDVSPKTPPNATFDPDAPDPDDPPSEPPAAPPSE